MKASLSLIVSAALATGGAVAWKTGPASPSTGPAHGGHAAPVVAGPSLAQMARQILTQPNISGTYQGSYSAGNTDGQDYGQNVDFSITIHQADGSESFTGVIHEPYSGYGYGVAQDGDLVADVRGTCRLDNGVIKMDFEKTYRYFQNFAPDYLEYVWVEDRFAVIFGEPLPYPAPDPKVDNGVIQYSGTLDPATGTLTGAWSFLDDPTDSGTFEISHVWPKDPLRTTPFSHP